MILKSQQRFRSEKHKVFAEEVNKTSLSANNDKAMQSIDSIKTYAFWTNKEIIHKKEETKWINIRKQHKTKTFNEYSNNMQDIYKNMKECTTQINNVNC